MIFFLTLAIALLLTNTASACSMCFYGNPNQSEVIALRTSVLVLLTIVIIVLGFFAKFFISVGRRSKLMSPH